MITIKEPDFSECHKYEDKMLTGEEIKIVHDWLELAIVEGGGVYGNEFKAWFPIIKKIMPPSTYGEIAWLIDYHRDETIAQEFLESVGLEN